MKTYLEVEQKGKEFFDGLRKHKWLVAIDTRNTDGPSFKTKREAVEYGRRVFDGIFIVWKRPLARENRTQV